MRNERGVCSFVNSGLFDIQNIQIEIDCMIRIEIRKAEQFVDSSAYQKAKEGAAVALKQLRSGKGAGSEWLGWRRILSMPDEAELERIQTDAEVIRQDTDILVVCGIGGSYLGARAVIEALNGLRPDNKPEVLFTGHHMGGRDIEQLIDYLEKPRDDGEPKSVRVNVISKSGSTLETALAFRTLRQWMEQRYGEQVSERIFVTTGPEGGVLNRMVVDKGYRKYTIPEDVGGRFSVLTPVGLFPVAVAGIDIQTLFYGAASMYEKLEKSADELLQYAAFRYCMQDAGKSVDVIGSFDPELSAFTRWVQQLLGESEGKEGKGIFPVPAAYSTDLHSIGQMVQQGRRNLIETLLVVSAPTSSLKIAKGGGTSEDGLEYLDGKSFHEINYHALEGTVEAHLEGGVPVILIILERLNAQNLGELIYFYELFTAVYVYLLGVNPFDQPGVEEYKKAMYRKLGSRNND